jgi:hypothetical protein
MNLSIDFAESGDIIDFVNEIAALMEIDNPILCSSNSQ